MEQGEYEVMYRNEDEHWWYWGLRDLLLRQAYRSATPGTPLRILDAGCGTGRNLAGLSWAKAFGIEMAAEAFPFLRKRGLDTVARGSIARLPFRDATFDLVLSADVLCCVEPPGDVASAREFHRVLKPGGTLLLNLPAYEWLRSQHDAAVHTRQRFTRTSLARLLTNAGLRIESVTYRNTLLFPIPVGVRAVQRWRRPTAEAELKSDVGAVFPPLNAVLKWPLALENAWIRAGGRLPYGLSLYSVARRP